MSRVRSSGGGGLNLSRQPFRNLRPIVRLAVFLWVLGGVLLVANVLRYWGYFTGSEDRRTELQELQQQVTSHHQQQCHFRHCHCRPDRYLRHARHRA